MVGMPYSTQWHALSELLRNAQVRAARSPLLPTCVEARMAIFELLEGWDDPHRRHAALDYQ
jgi:hypothetical protein